MIEGLDHEEIMYKNLMKAKALADAEGVKKAKIQYSPEYVRLSLQIEEAQLYQKELLEVVDEKKIEEYEAYRKKFSQHLFQKGQMAYKEWKAKLKKVKKVNNQALLNALDGDLDLFMKLANVTQVALKAHAEGNMNQLDLMQCVEEFEQIVDVEYQDTPMSQ